MTFRLALAFFLLATLPVQASPEVLVTIKPLHSLVASVMGDAGPPVLLIGGLASEHGFSLKASDARKIARADVIFQVGPELESYLVRPLATLGRSATIVSLNKATGVRLLPARKGGLWASGTANNSQKDPHVWLDPQNAIAMVRAIELTLAKADPSGAALYANNAARTIFLLRGLENRVAAITAPLRGKPYLVFHDAYQYFESRFGLRPAGAVTISHDRPVGARRISELQRTIDAERITCIFREPQFAPRLVNTLTEGRNLKIGTLDPLGADLAPGPELYVQLIDGLALSLSRCLAAPQKKA